MSEHSLETWTLRKPAITAQPGNGLVASQHAIASDVGASVLRDGGNAVDAAVAASFAIGAVEPWMSGLGGGGMMLVYRASDASVSAVDFGMRAPQALNPADYPLAENSGPAADLFNWPAVREDRNLRGYYSIAVPGQVAGMALALERFGTRSWEQSLQPTIELAEQGFAVDWYATLKIAAAARDLHEFAESRRVYLPDGFAPAAEWGGPLPRITLGQLGATLRRLASAGPEDFYRGALAQALIGDMAALPGSGLALDDLATYSARVIDAGQTRYRDASIYFAPGLSAGPSLSQALQQLSERLDSESGATINAETYANYAQILRDVYAERLATLGDSAESAANPACTTHISVVDKNGNMVALTQTLLSVFGSKVMLPQTGILMNNGIMWFDPRPGRPNSIAAGKRPLSNMCPTIAVRDDGQRVAIGASGGRRIMPSVFQLLSFLIDYNLSLDAAFHQPRLDVSGSDAITLDAALAPTIIAQLRQRFGAAAQVAPHGVYPALFACPNAIVHNAATHEQSGAAFVPSPWAKVSVAA